MLVIQKYLEVHLPLSTFACKQYMTLVCGTSKTKLSVRIQNVSPELFSTTIACLLMVTITKIFNKWRDVSCTFRKKVLFRLI